MATGISGAATDAVIVPVGTERAAIVTGITLSTDSATPVLVGLGFKKGAAPTLTFFAGFVSSSGPIARDIDPFNWPRGDLGYDVVLTAGGSVAFSVETKLTSFPAALGYIENYGASNLGAHWGLTHLPDENGRLRGQSEV